jgi:hypothetical protein
MVPDVTFIVENQIPHFERRMPGGIISARGAHQPGAPRPSRPRSLTPSTGGFLLVRIQQLLNKSPTTDGLSLRIFTDPSFFACSLLRGFPHVRESSRDSIGSKVLG